MEGTMETRLRAVQKELGEIIDSIKEIYPDFKIQRPNKGEFLGRTLLKLEEAEVWLSRVHEQR